MVGVKRSPFKGIVQPRPSPDILLGGRKRYKYRGCWMQERMLGAAGEESGEGCVGCRGSPPHCECVLSALHPHPRLLPLGHILTEEVRRGGSCQRLPAACKRDCSQHLHQQLHSRWQRSHWLVTSHPHKLQPQRLPRQLLASLGKPDPDSSEPKDSRLSHLKKNKIIIQRSI